MKNKVSKMHLPMIDDIFLDYSIDKNSNLIKKHSYILGKDFISC